jgi:murein DD-endopeptidase MepM/ murein hydrolase activator NlpD
MTDPVKGMKWAKYPVGDVTQWWGENPALYSGLGIGIDKHNGIDIVRPHGEHMFAVEDAWVVSVKTTADGYGKHVRLISKDFKREWTYGHCADIWVKLNQEVKEGQFIARMGNTGFVVSGNTPYWGTNPYAGTHVHFGLRFIELDRRGWTYPGCTVVPKFKTLNYDNGVKGSVNPLPLFMPPELLSSRIIAYASRIGNKEVYRIGEALKAIGK